MNIVFWGTPKYAVKTLEFLVNSKHNVVAVITQPDKRRARGSQVQYSPVKTRAIELGIDVFTTSSIKNDINAINLIEGLNADINIVVAFGQILPNRVLNYPKYGSWNGHASLLPKWRGAAPIQWTLLNGDKNTGVCIMSMEEGLDTGPILIQKSIPIEPNTNAHQLGSKLSVITAELMIEALYKIEDCFKEGTNLKTSLSLKEQKASKDLVSYARMIKKEDLKIDWKKNCLEIHRKVMALYPNAYTLLNGKRLKIHSTKLLTNTERESLGINEFIKNIKRNDFMTGHIIYNSINKLLLVKASDGVIAIEQGQLEGKKPSTSEVLSNQLKIDAVNINNRLS